jgi:ribosome-binding protein aMBF1 (putative translation factor)
VKMNYRQYLKKQLKNKQFKKEWDKLEPEYKLIESLIAARLKKGFTQEKLAKKIKTKQESISRVESGRVVPSIPFLKRIAQALDSRLEVKLNY